MSTLTAKKKFALMITGGHHFPRPNSGGER